jgi:photosystem I P700 chlorophyll a apoprotein A2
MLEHKEAIISHLLASLFLGFHTLGLYIHNDTVVAFGQPENKFYLNLYLLSTFKQLQVKQFMNLMFYYQIQLVQQQ